MAASAQPSIAVVSAAGRATFTAEQIAHLQRAGEATFHRATQAIEPHALAAVLDGATVAGVTPRAVPRLGPGEIAALPRSLAGIAVFATGVDHVDQAALAARGIELRRLPGYATTTVAEHTIGLLLLMSRRLHLSRDRVLGRVDGTTSVRGWELCHKTLGLVGLGRIGVRVARLAQAMGMEVIGADGGRLGPPGVRVCEFAEVLAESDVVSLHTSTRWGDGALIGADELARMRPGAHLINATRAGLVDEEAVIDAIVVGQLGGYAVDDRVGDAARERAARLLCEGRIVETDHTAWYAQEAIDRGVQAWVERIAGLADEQARAGRPVADDVRAARDEGAETDRVAGL